MKADLDSPGAIPDGLPPGLATDLAILRHGGSELEDRGDHLIVRTPRMPDFHWGHSIIVTDPGAAGDARRWVGAFRAAFPEAGWIAIGLPRMPADLDAWIALDLAPDVSDVLSTDTVPRQTALADGYEVRALHRGDREQRVARAIAENARTDEYDPDAHARFVRARIHFQESLSRRGLAAFFGAFADGELAADLGIVRCGTVARFQWVGTDAAHRRRGLASHLLGVAARWAGERGCERWVIVTGTDNPAGRIYRAVGFTPDVTTVEVYRPPARR